MRVGHLNYSDHGGGAARACYRIHKSLSAQKISSKMYVELSNNPDESIDCDSTKIRKLFNFIRRLVGRLPLRLMKTENKIFQSSAFIPSRYPGLLNNSEIDIINLHWIGNEMMSIGDLKKIKKPIVWTLHDMWGFCGSEHVSYDYRWRHGYSRSNRPNDETGLDINKWIWKRKMKHWSKPMHIVAPSNWMASAAKKSLVMRDFPVSVIHNPIDTNFWTPLNKNYCREILGIGSDNEILIFGAMGGTGEFHKGFDLLIEALNGLNAKFDSKLEIIIFGNTKEKKPLNIKYPIHSMGTVQDDITMKILYGASDLLAIPSRIDNLPNIGLEAQSCGLPIVAFDVCGLPDIVKHKENGYLAKPFDVQDYSNGIDWIISNRIIDNLGNNARVHAINNFSYQVISTKYINLYKKILNI
jgi:glycosyltransferase involved in cell wall biosynthesis